MINNTVFVTYFITNVNKENKNASSKIFVYT